VLLTIALLDGGSALTLASLALYGFGLLAMLWASALYHLARDPARKEILRRFDHSAIFVMIAGTYTPFALVAVGGQVGLALFAFVWVVAIVGVVLKMRFPRRWELAAVAAYLALGWVAVVALEPIVEALSKPVLVLLAAGGITYSLGVPVYLAKRLPFNVALWHGFVLVAAALHYAAILTGIARDAG
jgi:hemolysin III